MGTGRGEGSLEYARRKSDLAVSKLEEKIAKDKMKKRIAIGGFNRKLEKEDNIRDKLKDHSSMDKVKQALENKTPTTVSEARAQGWKPTGIMKMSDPPVIGFEKDGKVIWIQEKKDFRGFNKRQNKKKEDDNLLLTPKMMKGKTIGLMKKGGKAKAKSKYSKGGGVRAAKYKI